MGYPEFPEDHLLLRTLQGIKKQIGDPTATRLRITIQLMRTLKNQLRCCINMDVTDILMLWAAFTMAFFGFLRVSEFASPTKTTFDLECTLLRSDVNLGSAITVTIKAAKNDPFRRGHTLTIASSGSSVCACTTFTQHALAFQFTNGSYLTRQTVTDSIRTLLMQAGIPSAEKYSSHSFRAGAATTAAEANLPDWLIKTLGRWRSDSYQLYIKTPATTLHAVPRILANQAEPQN
ncbi:uncharacterized protein LOC102801650 [Saccoglossus kowalevskii]|uniref:Uncharacterized protein LOC102801650 n=1 Tax=Saccoglossus kowalevskii TaxID=10224 RepID=A0ABM0MRJ8_SACKO|nr:PREDICTED: uncharacterized protein LOC102801650 [Saccoglossus kowalevskii]